MPSDRKPTRTASASAVAEAPRRPGLRDLDPSDPVRLGVELAQRGRMVLDVTAADLEAAEAAYGAFHPTAWHFRNAWYEAQRSWDRLRARFGGKALESALGEPPLTVLALGPGAEAFAPGPDGLWPLPEAVASSGSAPTAPVLLVPIRGQTYRALRVGGTPLAPRLWRLTRLNPPLENGPYYACRLRDGATQCDCAEWTYQVDDDHPRPFCKHLDALASLGWL